MLNRPVAMFMMLGAFLGVGCVNVITSAEPPAVDQDVPSSPVTPERQAPVEARSKRIEPFPGVVVDFEHGRVEMTCRVIHPPEPIEQIICTPATREHETLFTANVLPSQLHAALLLLGAKPGTPGRFERIDDTVRFVPPTGDELDITVAVQDPAGATTITPVEAWIMATQRADGADGAADADGDAKVVTTTAFPESTWVFAGSLIQKNSEWMGEGEHYIADMTGSLIGFVTFGDEPVGVTRAIEEDSAQRGIDWRANVAVMPAEGTTVTVYLTRVVNASAKPVVPASSPAP
ncbi:MAG: hypothetical protein KC983_05220 [Phycisphaerales bacterium]|nr:hypothetical protein [Phycisphaerales bacterium]